MIEPHFSRAPWRRVFDSVIQSADGRTVAQVPRVALPPEEVEGNTLLIVRAPTFHRILCELAPLGAEGWLDKAIFAVRTGAWDPDLAGDLQIHANHIRVVVGKLQGGS